MSVCLVECKMKGECAGGDVSRHVFGFYLYYIIFFLLLLLTTMLLFCVVFSVVDDDAFDVFWRIAYYY